MNKIVYKFCFFFTICCIFILSSCDNNIGNTGDNFTQNLSTSVARSSNTNSNQQIIWSTCSDGATGFECGNITVPLDYNDASKGDISLPITIHRATVNKQGTVLIKFGGPWGDDTTTLHYYSNQLTNSLKTDYDIVSFAARGTSANSLICHTTDQNLVNNWMISLYKLDDFSTLYDNTVAFANNCTFNKIVDYVGSKNTVRDLEQIRKAINVDKISYIGSSYGTHLGLAYLLYYPNSIDKMILDSNLPPTNNYDDAFAKTRAMGVETTLNAFFDFCAQSGNTANCALYQHNSSIIKNQFAQVLQTAKSSGIPTSATYDNKSLTYGMLQVMTGQLMPLGGSSATQYWRVFAEGIFDAVTYNNADKLMNLYDLMTGYNPFTDSFPQATDFSQVGNVVVKDDFVIPDFYKSQVSWVEHFNQLVQQYPLSGGYFSSIEGSLPLGLNQKSAPLLPENVSRLETNAKVLLIGNKYDAATPLESTKSVANYLTNIGVANQLMVWNGVGHVSYMFSAPNGGCIYKGVDHFFATSNFPDDLACNDDTNPFISDN